MSETTASSDVRAYKFRLDPNKAQVVRLSQCAGAARVGYNMLIAHNREIHQEARRRRDALIASGVDPAAADAKLREQRRTDPAVRMLSYQQFSTTHLTPEIARHRAASDAIKAGADPAEVWADERYAEPWLHTVPRRVLVSGLHNAWDAFTNWMTSFTGQRAGRRVGYPRFKRKGRSRDSFTIPAETTGGKGTRYHHSDPHKGVIGDYKHLRLGPLGTIRTHQHTRRLVRACEHGGRITSFTVSRAADYWYVSVLVETPAAEPPAPSRAQRSRGAVGVDVGVHSLAALSTGELIANPRHGQATREKLTRAQRAFARTEKGSRGRQRAAVRVARIQHKLALQRATTLHKLTKALATGYETVAIEDLNVAGMTRSAKGTVENPGKNVAAKAGLNRSILDAALGELRRQLDYKTRWHGSTVTTIGRYDPSSKACSSCGTVKPKLPLSVRVYDCDQCGMSLDRDVNAARNILAWASNGRDSFTVPQTEVGADGRGGPTPPSPRGEGTLVRDQRSVKTGRRRRPATSAEQSAGHLATPREQTAPPERETPSSGASLHVR
ncbi:transposase [Kocuria marina subsp. indica]|uniref:RNA-guided endonuclease InsQ/TnpB family protein n=1 Tax=Kocuria marina TaxID=223184 RepID=UPI000EF18924|nr:RNA-guided endonuclease TnpB family protein [Kocuria indica]RLP57290.1 transposase [Kocuria indica]